MTSSVYRCSSTIRARDRPDLAPAALDDLYDARRVAAAIGIPHYIVNFEDRFDEQVVSNFIRDQRRTDTDSLRTLQCRSEVFDAARAGARLRADALATRHYARIERAPDGSFCSVAAPIPRRTRRIFCSR